MLSLSRCRALGQEESGRWPFAAGTRSSNEDSRSDEMKRKNGIQSSGGITGRYNDHKSLRINR